MQTEDLILWVDKAIEVREASYIKVDNAPAPIGRYTTTNIKALEQTKPEEAKDYDETIALMLIEYGNDITDWKKQIEDNGIRHDFPLLVRTAKEFIYKVDNGLVKSKDTYSKFKKALHLD